MTSNWILNHTERAEQYSLYPFAVDFSNVVSRAHQLRTVNIPDVHPVTALINPAVPTGKYPIDRMNMTAGDFTELYSGERYRDEFDAVATVFFLDTAPNVIKYIQTVRNCLKLGGVLINNGPLLYHHNSPSPRKDEDDKQPYFQRTGQMVSGQVELTVEEVLMLVSNMGFEIKDRRIQNEGFGYIQNPNSLLQNLYYTSYWVAKKVT